MLGGDAAPKKRDAVAPNLGAKFGFGNGQKMREILGFGGGTPNIYGFSRRRNFEAA